jgi:hypothetical protein
METWSERLYSLDDMRALLRAEVAKAGGQKAWGEANGVAQGYVSWAISGKQTIGPMIAHALGYEAVLAWRKTDLTKSS